MRAKRAVSMLEEIPVDFCADPDGFSDYEAMVAAAGFEGCWGEVAIGALTEPWESFPEGSAVVVLSSGQRCIAVFVDCVGQEPAGARDEARIAA